ncbi:MAG: CHAT domain-containing protein [Balneolaceae bacterium]|nr:CHAT domain-containing protein [Balneolaceae bacterium]
MCLNQYVIILILLTGIPAGTALAQNSADKVNANTSDTLDAFRVYQKADLLQREAHYARSTTLFREAASRYRSSRQWHRLFDSRYNIAVNLVDLGKFAEAERQIPTLEQLISRTGPDTVEVYARLELLKGRIDAQQSDYKTALFHFGNALQSLPSENLDGKIGKLKGHIYYHRGETYDSRGRYQKALDGYQRALEIYNRAQVTDDLIFSRVYSSIGVVKQKLGNHDSAIQYHRKSLAIDRRLLPHDHPNIANGLNNLAIIYYYQGDYSRSLDHMKQATQTLIGYWGKEHPQVAAGYNNISIVYSEIGELERAVSYMEKSIELKKQLFGEADSEVAIGYQNLGALYYDLDDFQLAIDYYKRAMKLHQRIFEGAHPEIANIYANLGQAYTRLGAYERAISYYRRDLAMNSKLLGSRHPYIGDTHTKLGEIYRKKEDFDGAIHSFLKAVDLLAGENVDACETGFAGLQFDDVTHPVMLLEALEQAAMTYASWFERSGNIAHLQQNLDIYLTTTRLIVKMRVEYENEDSRLWLGERVRRIYRQGLETAYTLYRQTGKSTYVTYAHYFAEHNKARVLLDQLRDIDAKAFAGVPDSLLAKEQHYRRRITVLNQQVKQLAAGDLAADSLRGAEARDSVFTYKQQLSRLIRKMEQEYPEYHRLKYQQEPVTPAVLQDSLLHSGETLIQYAFGTEDLFVFVISPDSVTLHSLDIASPDSLAILVNRFRREVLERGEKPDDRIAHMLYDRIFKPIEPDITTTRCIIIPDGPLNRLPFEALGTRSGNGESYLLDRYVTTYVPSASLFSYWRRDKPTGKHRSLLAMAPVFTGNRNSEPGQLSTRLDQKVTALPLSRYEVKSIDSLARARGYDTQILLQSEATESAFKQLAPGEHQILHLATHAFAPGDTGYVPGIVLAGGPGPSEDGILYPKEIYNLRLDAGLVVLSACETGMGRLQEGEGVMSLARAFHYAGAGRLFASLWKVDDRSTSMLMVAFYQHLMEGKSVQEAARKAKRYLKEQTRFSSPRYWAPFVMIGS